MMSKREKFYSVAIVVLLVLLAVKSMVIDNYKPTTQDEQLFYTYANEIAEEQYDGFTYKYHIASYKIVSIKKVEDKGVSVLEVVDPITNEKKLEEIDGKYKAKIRKYILWILPYGEDKIMSRK